MEKFYADHDFIIGGTVLDENVWKTSRRYLAALTFTQGGGKKFHTCGATLISRRVVLTAAREFLLENDIYFGSLFSFFFVPSR